MKQLRKKLVVAFALLGLMALLAGPALAQADPTPGTTPHLHAAAMLQRLTTKLNLTEEQQASAKQLAEELAAKMQPIHAAQQQLRTQLKAALQAAEPDAATVGKLVIQQHQNQAQIKPIMQQYHQQFQALLTPEQLATFNQLKANHAGSYHRRFMGGASQTQ
jgi:Spy/CpxP family protein refolding chaperone